VAVRIAAVKTLCLLGLGLLITGTSVSEQASASFVTGISLVGGLESCPVFVARVRSGSPAERAGIRSGDVLSAVGGTRVSTTDEAVNLLHSETPDPVTLTLLRGEQPYVATVGRERSSLLLDSHRKVLSNGMVAPLDATESEMKAKLQALTPSRFVGRVFPTHYPSDESVYYPGFEILILKDPNQVAVLGIEDGPAQRAGVHWGTPYCP
jgi:hypothetical protein